MQPLFEAKATFNRQLTIYNIYRISPKKYRAEIFLKRNEEANVGAPSELVLVKENGSWQTVNTDFKDLAETIGVEIDAFTNGYGDLLGKIGVG